MEFFRIKKDIPFMKHALVFNVISAITFVAAVFFLWKNGLNYSIEFTGGTAMEVAYKKPADSEAIRKAVASVGIEDAVVQQFGTAENVLIRLPAQEGKAKDTITQTVFTALCSAEAGKVDQIASDKGDKGFACRDAANNEPVALQSVELVGKQVGEELASDGLKALAAVVAGVMLYLAFRFEWKFAVSAIIANLHDVVIILGFFAFFRWEFSLSVLAGVLAVLGYSVNESVVIFDRIRENFRKLRKATVVEAINNAITSTISRTIITHGCTQMMVLSMLLFGGQTIHNFAIALTIGICFGIYSSVFVAAAVAMWLGVKREDLIKPVKEKDTTGGAVV
ncbi:MAG: protein translocase subunit SecF [Burkholderiaceae bacterium]|nr:protein translocase subunit SecF [Burkholderiaceae bacterium]